MYIAVILENYDEAHEQEEIGVTEDDLENFYSAWEKYDPHATQFIKLEKIYDFVAELAPPFGVPKPNDMAITSFNLPIIKGDLIHCLDSLHGVTTYALGSVEDSKEFTVVQKQMDEKFLFHFPVRVKYTPITTTMERKKLEIAARTLQRAWKTYKIQRTLRKHNENGMVKNSREKSLI
jgi:voltage-gated cation channel